MSSLAVRDALEAEIASVVAPLEVYDLSDYQSIRDVLPAVNTVAVLLQYITSTEEMRNIAAEGNQGYEESGTVVVHVVEAVGNDSANTLTLCDTIRTSLRGRRVTDRITVEQFDPFTDFGGNAVTADTSAWKTWAANMFYVRRDCG